MYILAQIYDEAKYALLRLHKIVKDLGMEEHEIINVLELANSHHLEHLQWKVEYLRNDIEMLEVQKTKCSNHILILNRRIDKFQETLNNNSKFSQSNASWYSVDISYAPMND
jgi:DNA-binding transcriptional MerR regulator